jgi:hypothetical protein
VSTRKFCTPEIQDLWDAFDRYREVCHKIKTAAPGEYAREKLDERHQAAYKALCDRFELADKHWCSEHLHYPNLTLLGLANRGGKD